MVILRWLWLLVGPERIKGLALYNVLKMIFSQAGNRPAGQKVNHYFDYYCLHKCGYNKDLLEYTTHTTQVIV